MAQGTQFTRAVKTAQVGKNQHNWELSGLCCGAQGPCQEMLGSLTIEMMGSL